jgi:hypothetical protein
MNAGMAITAAEPSGLWGLLKESFAVSAELAHAAADPNANASVKAVVADFATSQRCRKGNAWRNLKRAWYLTSVRPELSAGPQGVRGQKRAESNRSRPDMALLRSVRTPRRGGWWGVVG